MRLLDRLVSDEGEREWRANWPTLAIAMVGFAFSQIHLYSLGVMVAPLEQEFGWSRTQITSGLLIVSLVSFPFTSLMGRAIDVFGTRRIALYGAAFYCGSVAALSFAQQALWTWWVLWLVTALGYLAFTPAIWIAGIAKLFDASRGLALATTMSAAGFMSLGGPILTDVLVDHFGWRMAYLLLGGTAAAILLPLIVLFFAGPEGSAIPSAQASAGPNTRTGLTIPEALKASAFIKLTGAGLIISIMTMSLLVNLVPILTSLQLDKASVPAIAGVIGVTHFAGRLIGGLLLDRFDARAVGAATVILPSMACALLLAFPGVEPIAFAAVLVFGFTVGAEMDVIAFLIGRFVGMRNFGTLFGIVLGVMTLGNGLGPGLASLIYDLTHAYNLVLWIAASLSIISAVMLFTLGAYPTFAEPAEESASVPAQAAGIGAS